MGFEKYVTSIDIFCDNHRAIELSKNAVCHKRSKYIDISYKPFYMQISAEERDCYPLFAKV